MKLVSQRADEHLAAPTPWQPRVFRSSHDFSRMNLEVEISSTHDAELLGRVAARDPEALSELYDRFSGILFSIAGNILRDTSQAEDVLQEVFVQIWERASVYDAALGKPLSWAVTLTRNKAIDRLRATQRRNRLLDEATAEWETDAPDLHSHQPAVMTNETARFIRAALQELPAEQRQAIELAFFSGLTQSEIASELRQPLGTVKARIRRGMLQLRERLEGIL
ncbi:MAG: sigma-70 family RNA polymerase sigma factor [Verrucomicrobia bacterium]|nr:sigma-70 family RNA polymerase sigma factor [Verrucomicrobiota bacterium]